jgi:hypothetical protein
VISILPALHRNHNSGTPLLISYDQYIIQGWQENESRAEGVLYDTRLADGEARYYRSMRARVLISNTWDMCCTRVKYMFCELTSLIGRAAMS